MANPELVAHARTNYFRVHDAAQFAAMCRQYGLLLVAKDDRVGLVSSSRNGIPTTWTNPETGPVEDIDVPAQVARMLRPGEVAIFVETARMEWTILNGWATAVNAAGEYRHLGLHDIVAMARELTDRPDDVTEPTA